LIAFAVSTTLAAFFESRPPWSARPSHTAVFAGPVEPAEAPERRRPGALAHQGVASAAERLERSRSDGVG